MWGVTERRESRVIPKLWPERVEEMNCGSPLTEMGKSRFGVEYQELSLGHTEF